jgi:hypothetical protein
MFGSFAVVGVCFGIAIYLFVKLLAEKSSHHDAMTGLVTTIVTFVWSWMGLNLMTVSGRRLRIRGRDRMAKTQNGEGWTKNLIIHELLARPDRRLLAEAWAQNARAEHASIAAFSRLSLQLMALGAPPYLLAMTHQAALDEVRHAESAFSLASLLAGTPIRPAPFPDILIDQSGTVERVTLAIDSLTDGCIGEGIAARTLKLAAERVASPALHQVLKRTAEDEAQHQLLAWEIVTWLMGSSPEIRRALEAAIHRQSSLAPSPDQLASDLDAELCALMGRLPPEEEQTLRDDIIEEARHRLGSACLPTASALV